MRIDWAYLQNIRPAGPFYNFFLYNFSVWRSSDLNSRVYYFNKLLYSLLKQLSKKYNNV